MIVLTEYYVAKIWNQIKQTIVGIILFGLIFVFLFVIKVALAFILSIPIYLIYILLNKKLKFYKVLLNTTILLTMIDFVRYLYYSITTDGAFLPYGFGLNNYLVNWEGETPVTALSVIPIPQGIFSKSSTFDVSDGYLPFFVLGVLVIVIVSVGYLIKFIFKKITHSIK